MGWDEDLWGRKLTRVARRGSTRQRGILRRATSAAVGERAPVPAAALAQLHHRWCRHALPASFAVRGQRPLLLVHHHPLAEDR